MAEIKYEKLDRIREEIRRDRDRIAKLQEKIKAREAKLKEEEANQIVSDVCAMNLSPEQLAEFLELIKSGKISEMVRGQYSISMTNKLEEMADEKNEDEDIEEDENDEE